MSTPTLSPVRDRQYLEKWLSRQKRVSKTVQQVDALDSTFSTWRDTAETVWRARLEEVVLCLGIHGRFPRSDATDTEEKCLGIWLSTQRYRAAHLTVERRELLDTRLPGWLRNLDEVWEQRFRDVKACFAVTGEMPPKNAADNETRSSNFWLNNQRKLPQASERRARLDQELPGWDRGNEDIWESRLADLVAFVAAHDRLPKLNESIPGGRRIGSWLGTQRTSKDLSAHRRSRLNESVPGWDLTKDDRWSVALKFVADYYLAHGKLPSSRSSDTEVAYHGRWLGTQRRSKNLSSSRIALLDAHAPAWRETAEQKWLTRLRYVADFEKAHGRFPSSSSADTDEAQAARWLGQQKLGIGMTPERSALLDSTIPRWKWTLEDLWLRRLKEYEEFYRAHGRRPRQAAADTDERSLAGWYNNMKDGGMSPERAAALKAATIGDQRTNDQVWADRLDEVCQFVATHGRFPASTNKKPGERPLATWLVNQRLWIDKMSPERRNTIESRLPGWSLSYEDIWKLRLKECVEFVRANGRFPTVGASASAQEKKTGHWYNDQRKAKSLAKLDRVAILDEQLPGWRG